MTGGPGAGAATAETQRPGGEHERLPDFVLIGAQKAGTTTLWNALRQHPGIFMPAAKELNFFIRRDGVSRSLPWYRAQFESAPPGALLGEASPGYTMAPVFGTVARDMASLIPRARLIYVVREPFARMRSAYAHNRADGLEIRTIGDALVHELHYSLTSCYALQLELFLKHYPEERVLVLRAEDLDRAPAAEVRRVLQFLGIADPDWAPPGGFPRLNESQSKLVPRRTAVRCIQLLRTLHLSRNQSARITPHRWLCEPLDPAELEIPASVIENWAPMFERDAERLVALTGVDPRGDRP